VRRDRLRRFRGQRGAQDRGGVVRMMAELAGYPRKNAVFLVDSPDLCSNGVSLT
jgi:hypothetical protein